MRACRDNGVTSASLYPFHQVTGEQYDCLARYTDYFPVNARFSLGAFRELRKQGDFVAVKDPSSQVRRSEFYGLIAERLTGKKTGGERELKALIEEQKPRYKGFGVSVQPIVSASSAVQPAASSSSAGQPAASSSTAITMY